MDEDGDVGQGVRMALAATVSAVIVAALTIAAGQALIVDPASAAQSRTAPLVLVSR
ncbi:hypothetical protein [Brevundimonas bacteroides]|uniref:hypothetical protein n=1 Tax=Brevundimonas bacteroides TaxID=74311 RepID=UPI000A68B95C|nr:hypothetical protein [Brevundimonas bacteroides]